MVTMKIVAKKARTAMTMRQCLATPTVEQDWGSVTSGVFEVVAGDLVVISRGIKMAVEEVELVVVLVVLVEKESVG